MSKTEKIIQYIILFLKLTSNIFYDININNKIDYLPDIFIAISRWRKNATNWKETVTLNRGLSAPMDFVLTQFVWM